MRLEGESRGLQRPRQERRGPSNICHQREENWQRRKIVTQLLKKRTDNFRIAYILDRKKNTTL